MFPIQKILKKSLFIAGDMASIILASIFVYLTLQSFISIETTFPLLTTLLFLVYSILALSFFNVYNFNSRFTSIRELLFILLGLTTGFVLAVTTVAVGGLFSAQFFYRLLLIYMVSILFVGVIRISKRLINEVLRTPAYQNRAIIFGAGNAADQLLRDLSRQKKWNMNVIGVFDDNPDVHGLFLHGYKILGDRNKMFTLLRVSEVDELIIAIPSLQKKELKKLIDNIHGIVPNLKVKVLPSFHIITDHPVKIQHIRDISILDLLGREPRKSDLSSMSHFIKEKTILITGAGGSIGSELVRQCIALKPERLVALDIDETELFNLINEMQGSKPLLEPCVACINDEPKLRKVLSFFKPDIIFHAAAYKHVPMMEFFPEEAIKTNIGGTLLLSRLSIEYEIEKFVLISTDKAVNPTNVMGATKRVAEQIVVTFNDQNVTKFMAVRFGNVLGSRGSVVPIFMKQIRNGGPLTITDKNIVRYFMTIPEAVLLVIQSGMMGEGGEVFVLDMGEPVRIDDMARQLIRLHGLEPDRDIEIKYTGLRPGEKMYEELLKNEESEIATSHKLITKAIFNKDLESDTLISLIHELLLLAKTGSAEELRLLLSKIVPNYSQKSNNDVLPMEKIG